MKFATRLCLSLLFGLCVALSAGATAKKTLLILNSYHEDEYWGNALEQPIINQYEHSDSIKCVTMYLNGANVPDSAAYNTIANAVFDRFATKHPDYVVMLGNFAFNLRDRMKQEWDDVPFVIISRTDGFGLLNDYFTGKPENMHEVRRPFADVRDKYDFTFVLMPDHTSQTVDMMMNLIPDMESFVFLSDESYVNQVCASTVYNYLLEKYPGVSFKWVQASEKNSDEFLNYLFIPDPKLGILFSSWAYEIQSTRGYLTLTSKDLNQIKNSANPVFAMRRAYMSLGCIGGIFSDVDDILAHILEVVDKMVSGYPVSDIPFYYPKGDHAIINYTLLEKYGLNEKACPKDTEFINRQPTLFEKYGVIIIITALLAVLSIVLLLIRTSEQRKKIDLLRRHSNFVNNMPVPYTCMKIRTSTDGKIQSVKYTDNNVSFDKIVSDNSSDGSTKGLLPDSRISTMVDEMLKTGKSHSYLYHFEPHDTYFEFSFYPVKKSEQDNKAKELVVDLFARDVTSAHKLQKELRETASVLDLAIDIAKIIPYKLNWSSRILSFDISNLSNRKYNDAIKEKSITVDEYLHRIMPEDVHIMRELIDVIEKGEIDQFCVQYRVASFSDPDKIIWVENHGAVVSKYDNGKPKQIIGSFHDISESKEHEEVMAAALVKAEESDRMKSTFLANMSHEIRTPLNAIVGFSNMIIKEKDEKTKLELASIITRNNDLLLNLVNDVLDLAKIESNDIDLIYTVCDINDILSSICKTISIRVPKGVKLNTVYYEDSCVVETDSARVSQVLINLLTNACKFTSKGSITVGYEIHHSDNMIYIFVRDTGIGIPKEEQDRVFDRFVKLNSFAQGTGLGLAISRKIVEKMGGQIGVTSDGEGYGSRFWFTIPYKPVEVDESVVEVTDDVTEEPNVEIFTAEDSGIPDEDKPLILVAEDNYSNFWLVRHMLASKYRIVNARNGLEAVEYFKRYNPSIILMDINMPEMDGYGAVTEIRKLSTTVPIIAVTAYAFPSDRIRILDSGFDAYVAKPITEISLYSAIAEVTSKHS